MPTARKKAEGLEDEWMSLPQAAAELGCTRHTVLSSIIRGDLVADIVAGRTVVTRESVAKLKAARKSSRRAAAV